MARVSKNLSFSKILNGSKSWCIGATENKGICALSDKPYQRNICVLWQPDGISKGVGRTVLFEEYLKIKENKTYQKRAQEIGLELDLAEKNPSYFRISGK